MTCCRPRSLPQTPSIPEESEERWSEPPDGQSGLGEEAKSELCPREESDHLPRSALARFLTRGNREWWILVRARQAAPQIPRKDHLRKIKGSRGAPPPASDSQLSGSRQHSPCPSFSSLQSLIFNRKSISVP